MFLAADSSAGASAAMEFLHNCETAGDFTDFSVENLPLARPVLPQLTGMQRKRHGAKPRHQAASCRHVRGPSAARDRS